MNLDEEPEILLGDGTEEKVPKDIVCEDTVFDLAFHPTDNFLTVGRVSGIIDVHEYRRNDTRLVSSIRQHEGSVRGLEFSEDGKYLVSVGSDRHVKVLDCAAQQTIVDCGPSSGGGDGGGIMKKTQKKLVSKAAAASGDALTKQQVAAARASALRTTAGGQHHRCPHETALASVNICSDTLVSTGDDDGIIAIWDMRTGKPAHVYHEHGDYVSQMLYFSEVDQLVSCSGDTCVGVYSLKAGKMMDASMPRKDELTSMVFMGATNDIVCSTASGKLPIWKFGSWTRPYDVHGNHPKECDGLVAYNDNIFLSGACDGAVRVIQHYPTRSLLCHLGGYDRRRFSIHKIRISADRKMIAYCGDERFVQFQDIEFLGSEEELDRLRTKAEAKYMQTIRKVADEDKAVAADAAAKQKQQQEDDDEDDGDDEDWTSMDSDDDSDDDDDDSDFDDSSEEDDDVDDDDELGGDDDGDDVDQEDRLRARRQRAMLRQNRDPMMEAEEQEQRRQHQQQQQLAAAAAAGGDDDDGERQLTRQEKRERVAAAKWLKKAQKERVDFKRERGKKRVRGFWSALT